MRFRSKNKTEAASAPAPAAQAPPAQAPPAQAPPAAGSSTGFPAPGAFSASELTVFDGKGNPTVMVYSYDSTGKMVVRPKGRRKAKH